MAVSAMPTQSVRVVKSANCGRSLVFTSKFARGQCILEELPYVYTLLDNKRGLFCDFCLKQCSTLKKCTRCKSVSYCNESCQQGDWARCHKQDCKTLKRIHPMPYPYLVQLLSQIIRKQRRSPPCTQDDEDCFPTTVDQLESHHEKLSDTRRDECETLLFVLKNIYNCEEDVLPQPSSLLKMFGATICNDFSIMDDDLNGIAVGIYLRASMVNHSCDYNCVVVFDGRKLQLRTIKDVEKGDECTISYVNVMDPTKERQAKLEERYHFTCKCVRCEEINAFGPDDGLAEELRGLEKFMDQIKKQMQKSQDWTEVLQQFEPYLKPCSPLLPHHPLLVEVRIVAFEVCIKIKSWGKAAEIGQLLKESYRHHYGPYHPSLGLHLLKMCNVMFNLERLQEARRYIREAESVLEVTHGPHHSLMMTTSVQELLCYCRFPLLYGSADNTC